MSRPEPAASPGGLPEAAPRYELRVRRHGPADTGYEIWQTPSPGTPSLRAAVRVAGLRGRNLDLVEHRILRRLARSGVRPTGVDGTRPHDYALTEDLALTLGLIFRTLAPMRSRENMRAVIDGIESMEREEAAYWLGMAMHRKHPRRVLTALRLLLTNPRPRPRPGGAHKREAPATREDHGHAH